ncbi:MAG: FHA domain-containing protein [Nannocystaceae bacterium]
MVQEDRIVLPRRGAATVSCAAGLLRVSASDDGGVELGFDDQAFEVMLEVTEAIELRDGDLVCAGRQWLSFEAGREDRPPRLHVLDPMGEIHMTLIIRGSSWTLGRGAGDVVFPWDHELSELHLQVLVRGGTAFVQSLSRSRGTWVLVRSGEIVPGGCTLAVGDRVMRVFTPAPLGEDPDDETDVGTHTDDGTDADATVPDPEWSTQVYAAA